MVKTSKAFGKGKFTKKQILEARKIWDSLSPLELLEFYHYRQLNSWDGIDTTTFWDYLVTSAWDMEFCKKHDC